MNKIFKSKVELLGHASTFQALGNRRGPLTIVLAAQTENIPLGGDFCRMEQIPAFVCFRQRHLLTMN